MTQRARVSLRDSSAANGGVQMYETVLKDLGGFGCFQRRIFILVSLFEAPAAWAMLLPILTSAEPRWTCGARKNETFPPNTSYTFDNGDINVSTTMQRGICEEGGAVCHGLTFDTDEFTSIVSEWGLVCDAKAIPGHITSIQMGGVLVGALIAGQLADLFGRRKTLFGAYSLLLIFWFSSAFSSSWHMFAALRFCVGALIGGTLVVNFVLPMEFVLPKWRTFCGCIGFWAIGFMTLALWGYAIRDWRTLTISSSCSGIVLLGVWRWIPESPRWLFYRGRVKEASEIIEDIARVNGRPKPDIAVLINFFQREKEENLRVSRRYSYWHLCSSWRLALNSLILMYLWLVSSSVYYGMSLNVRNLSGNRYLNIFFSGMVEIPALVYLLIVNNKLGRRKTLFSLMMTAACFCFSILILDVLGKLKSMSTLATVLSLIGKSAISGGWAAVQVLSAECFPTVIRNIGIASCSMSARIGGIIAPQLVILGKAAAPLPFTVFGCLTVVAAIAGCLLPEKKGIPLPDILSDVKANAPSNYWRERADIEMEDIALDTKVIMASQ